jgi:DNA polymerase-3 subunit gamma/tau
MSYTALYRKFRPAIFDGVKGQDHIVTTLKNQIKAGRVGHAYLFTGTRGTGKTTIAKIFARAVNCEHPVDGSPCEECAACKAIAAGTSMNVIEIDAASNNGVDNIREIVDEVSYSPAEGKYKVYIIDEVHMLSIGAFNALLKTLEEPPSYVIFILATTEVHKIPITILSRCQRYDFKRITIDTIAARMRELADIEGVEVEEKALRYIAKAADGSMRDGLSLLDQCIAFHIGEKLTFDMALDVLGAVDTGVFSRLVREIMARNVAGCIQLLEEIVMQGRELGQFVLDFTWYLRNLMLLKASSDNGSGAQMQAMEDIMEVSSDNLLKLKEEAAMIESETLLRYIRIMSELSGQLRYANGKRILIEIALIKLCKPAMEIDAASVLERVRAVEEQVEKGIVVQAAPGYTLEEPRQQVERPKLPDVLPEEMIEVIQNFTSYRRDMTGLMKTSLKHAELSVSPDGALVIGVPDGYESDYFIRFPENVQALEDFLEDAVGKHVNVQIVPISQRTDFERQYPDTSELIRMDLLEEGEE